MEKLGNDLMNTSLIESKKKSRVLLYVSLIFAFLLIVLIVLFYVYRSVNIRNELNEKTQINQQLYFGEGFNRVFEEDTVWQGISLRGYIDGELIYDEFSIPGISYKNKLAIRLYYSDNDLHLRSVLVPLIVGDEYSWVVLDQASQSSFKERGVVDNKEKIKYFVQHLEGKNYKILTISLRPDRLTRIDEDQHFEIWNQYYSQNEKTYSNFITEGDESIRVVLPRSLTSDLVNDKFIILSDQEQLQ